VDEVKVKFMGIDKDTNEAIELYNVRVLANNQIDIINENEHLMLWN
jgi:hypothetical protein